ncbi:MAG: ATP-binding cassette domain-containing protein [Actinomycetales bacterium]|nr:ATP-binding cassette domain-containing protein [Actinomycetales bacterium]
MGLVGENGAGKSTLLKVIVGAVGHDAGEVDLRGRLGYCPQEPILYARLTCDEHLELFGKAYRMSAVDVDRARESLYATFGFGEWADVRVDELSGGTRAKLNLALALLPDPDVLLLDEPYAGFDWDTYQGSGRSRASVATRAGACSSSATSSPTPSGSTACTT